MSLSFSEKRGLQKTVVEKLADLKDGGLSFKEKREAQKLLRDALEKLSGKVEQTSDFNYTQDGMFTTFFPNNKKAEEVFAEMASFTDGTGKFLNIEAESVIGRLRKAGYSVTKLRQKPVSDDDILNELSHSAAADSPFTPILSGEMNNLFDQAAQATDTDPSEAQKLAGNYKKGAASFQGLDIAIENPANSSRKGVNEAGENWENHMPVHYGYFKGTKGADGDPIDVFVGSNEASEKAFIIDQINGSGEFDEHKVMLGFETAQSAKTAYLASYDEDWKGNISAITEVAIDDLKAWLKSGDKSSRFQPSPPDSRESSFPGIPGKESEVRTAKGTKVNTQFTILEADKLIASHTADGRLNPDFPQELQPRDRSRDASKAWIQKTAKDLDPGLLGRTKKADSGAPIIGPDRIVESGNGRTLAIIEAYRIGAAKEYRDWLIEEAEIYGFTPDQVKAMSQPVLVRVRTSAIDRQVFAVEANQDDKLAMTATEKAKADAGRLTPGLMSRFSPGEDGDLLVAANRDFIRGFLQSLGDAEAAQYATKSGEPTGTLIARIQAAVFAKAYEDERLLELMADTAKPENANLIKALSAAAPEFIMAREANENGTHEVSSQLADSIGLSLDNEAVRSLIDAANIVRKARRENMDVGEYVSQMGLFGDIDPGVAAMAVFIAQNNRSAKRLGVAFKAMARFVRQELEHGNNFDMFGERQVDMSQVVEAANRAMENEYGEGSYAIGIQNSSGGLFESLERRRRKTFKAIYG